MVDKLQEKLEILTGAILRESKSETEKILSEVRRRQEAARAASSAALKSEIAQYKKERLQKMRSEQSRRISLCLAENRRELLRLRNEYSEKVFELLTERIKAFTETPEYLEALKGYLNKGLSRIKEFTRVNVTLRKADMKYVDEFPRSLEGYDLFYNEGLFELGGLRLSCPAENISVDMTYDTELKDLAGHFAEMFGLEMD